MKNKERKLEINRKYFFLFLSRFYSAPNSSFLIFPLTSLGTGPKGNFEEERKTIERRTSRNKEYIIEARL
jgi:hypothetical protein